ncbi:MAG: hypothetical protein EPN91_07290 [Salinibacterium sp.]|nr:MAG: hypothetical protein EPN91_07290 [Salinibacterium sp.]
MNSLKWVHGGARCASDRALHIVRTRHPDNPKPPTARRHGPVGIGQFPVTKDVPIRRDTSDPERLALNHGKANLYTADSWHQPLQTPRPTTLKKAA